MARVTGLKQWDAQDTQRSNRQKQADAEDLPQQTPLQDQAVLLPHLLDTFMLPYGEGAHTAVVAVVHDCAHTRQRIERPVST